MSYLARYHHNAAQLGQVFMLDKMDQINCDTQTHCDKHSHSNLCQRMLFTFWMTRRQYYQITNLTEHIKETYLALKNRFLGMIDYLDETLQSLEVDKKRKKRASNKKLATPEEIKHVTGILDTIAELGRLKDKNENLKENPKEYIPHHMWINSEKIQVGTLVNEEKQAALDSTRTKHNPIVWATLGWGVYSNKKQIDKIKKNIETLQAQNILQDRKIDKLARYMNLTMEKVREHDERIYNLEVQMVQLRNSLIELSYGFDYNVIASHLLRNAHTAVHRLMIGLTAAQHNVDEILEYLRAMATHQCSPVIISPPVLRKLLQKVEDRITPNPRLKVPYDSETDIWRFYDILWITPVVLDKLLVVLLTIPLTDQSLEMNIY